MMPATNRQPEAGYVLLLTLITGMALLITLTGIINLSLINYSSARRSLQDISSLYVAEAGADQAAFALNQDNAYTGTNTVCPITASGASPVTLFDTSSRGRATYETCVTNGTIAREKIIYAVGKLYLPASSTQPLSTSRVKVILEGSITGSYAIQTGPGGLIMTNSAHISNGPLYVGGYLDMSSSASIGSAASPITVGVANARCPTPATSSFPQICSTGIQPNPITISNTAHIYGAVTANGQTNNSGMTNPGLVGGGGVTPPSLPIYDRDAQKAAVASTMTATAASCNGNDAITYPANVHITGSVTAAQNCKITVNGNVWIDGNFNMTQKAIIVPGAGVTIMPVIMVDGASGVDLGNQSQVSTNAGGIGLEFITFYSTAGCSPNCSNVTGADLYNSEGVTTINIGNQGAAAGTYLYARWSRLNVGQGGTLGTILGQTISLANTGNVSFSNTSSGGTLTYDVRYYEKY